MPRHPLALGAALLLAASAALAQPTRLPALKIDPAEVSVSGLSSGGFMTVQMHVAYSATFTRGAGVVAGGPFFCAEGTLANATGRCMAHSAAIPVQHLADTTRSWAQQGLIDPVEKLQTSRVYLFSGTQDPTVKPGVMTDLRAYYGQFVPAAQIVFRNDVPAGHAMVTDDFGGTCSTTGTPFINDCDLDLAGDMLRHLHGTQNARNNATLAGQFIEFDQSEFVQGHGMADTGWLYVPPACAAIATPCRLHVVFHGCRQNTANVGQQYVRSTGYNRWADTNRMVVLYPQTSTSAVNSCWDWWGYDRADYARKSGPQMAAVRAMVGRLLGEAAPPAPTAPCITASNATHVAAGRATVWWGAVRAKGSNESLGWWFFGSATLRETAPGVFEKVSTDSCR
jgi:poly(3-hydroxybutyrate) depolymerase